MPEPEESKKPQEQQSNLPAESANHTPAKPDSGVDQPDSSDAPQVTKKRKKKTWFNRTFKAITGHDPNLEFLVSASMEVLIPKIQPLIKKAKPRLIAYLAGYDEKTGEWSFAPDGKNEERIIVARLTKQTNPDDPTDGRDVRVEIYRKRLTKVMTPKGYEKEALEELHSAEEWLANTIFGGNYEDVFQQETTEEKPEKQPEEK